MNKVVRNSWQRVEVAAMEMPAIENAGDSQKYFLRYLLLDGTNKRVACTRDVYLRVIGKQRSRRGHSGWFRAGAENGKRRFHVYVDTPTSLIMSADAFPYFELSSSSRIDTTDYTPEQKLLQIEIFEDGCTYTRHMPPSVSLWQLNKVLLSLDAKSQVEVGDEIAGVPVTAIKGRLIFLDVDSEVSEDENLSGSSVVASALASRS